jgi:hypothetical protein
LCFVGVSDHYKEGRGKREEGRGKREEGRGREERKEKEEKKTYPPGVPRGEARTA